MSTSTLSTSTDTYTIEHDTISGYFYILNSRTNQPVRTVRWDSIRRFNTRAGARKAITRLKRGTLN